MEVLEGQGRTGGPQNSSLREHPTGSSAKAFPSPRGSPQPLGLPPCPVPGIFPWAFPAWDHRSCRALGQASNGHRGTGRGSGGTHLLLEGDAGEGAAVEVVALGGEQVNERADGAVVRQPLLQRRGSPEQLGGRCRWRDRTGVKTGGSRLCFCGLELWLVAVGWRRRCPHPPEPRLVPHGSRCPPSPCSTAARTLGPPEGSNQSPVMPHEKQPSPPCRAREPTSLQLVAQMVSAASFRSLGKCTGFPITVWMKSTV